MYDLQDQGGRSGKEQTGNPMDSRWLSPSSSNHSRHQVFRNIMKYENRTFQNFLISIKPKFSLSARRENASLFISMTNYCRRCDELSVFRCEKLKKYVNESASPRNYRFGRQTSSLTARLNLSVPNATSSRSTLIYFSFFFLSTLVDNIKWPPRLIR